MALMCEVLYDAMGFSNPEVVAFPDIGMVIRIRVLPRVQAIIAYHQGHWFAKELLVDPTTGYLEDHQPFGPPMPVTSRDADPVTSAKEIGGFLMERIRSVLENEGSSGDDRIYALNALTQLANRIEQGPSRY